VGPLGSGPRLVGRIGSRVWASASFHNEPLDKLEALRNAFKTYLLTYLQKTRGQVNPRITDCESLPLTFSLLKVMFVRCWPLSVGTNMTSNCDGPSDTTLLGIFCPEGPQIPISSVPSPAPRTSTATHYTALK